MTEFSSKIKILAELWSAIRDDEDLKDDLQDFIEYNDLGLPLAYLIDLDMAIASVNGNKCIEETFDLFLTSFDITEDIGFETLDDIFAIKGMG
jgi:hypothetical protein